MASRKVTSSKIPLTSTSLIVNGVRWLCNARSSAWFSSAISAKEKGEPGTPPSTAYSGADRGPAAADCSEGRQREHERRPPGPPLQPPPSHSRPNLVHRNLQRPDPVARLVVHAQTQKEVALHGHSNFLPHR